MNGHFSAVGEAPSSDHFDHGIQVIDEDKEYKSVNKAPRITMSSITAMAAMLTPTTQAPTSTTTSSGHASPRPASTTTSSPSLALSPPASPPC